MDPISKVLIIRFSSIGDVTQALSVASRIKSTHPNAIVHFLTRSDMVEIFNDNPSIQQVWSVSRDLSFYHLLCFFFKLNSQNYSHVYDCHNNLRSFFARLLIRSDSKLIRSIYRWKRFLLLNFKINLFEMPFSGQRDLLMPLTAWGIDFKLPDTPLIYFSLLEQEKLVSKFNLPHRFIVLVPSAAYELKRWPLEKWKNLIISFQENHFVILAGPKDEFTKLLSVFPNVTNLSGLTTLRESAGIISKSSGVIANDTGLMHFAEQLGIPTIALMGPAPFGFPSRISTRIVERQLSCRPCSKHGQGPCTNSNYQECLNSISVAEVKSLAQTLFGNS